eukprot:EG_transcript_4269
MPLAPVGICSSTGLPIDLFYETFGDPTDDAILLIMGLGAQMVVWTKEWCEMLADQGYFVIRFDNRDVGLSTHLDSELSPSTILNYLRHTAGRQLKFAYRLSDMARDTVGLLDYLRIPAAHVVGASMGGMIAQVMALEYPYRVKSLCCIMSTTGEPDLPKARISVMLRMSRAIPNDRERWIRGTLQMISVSAGKKYFDPEFIRVYLEEAYDRSNYRGGFTRQAAAILEARGRRKLLSFVAVPTLVIHGLEDPLIPADCGVDIHESVPGSTLMLVEDMGHTLPRPLYKDLVEAIAANARLANVPPDVHKEVATDREAVLTRDS